jgi:hypothetical protein
MPQYLVAIHLPDDHDTAAEDDGLRRDISALNDAMVAAGVRAFVGGLEPARLAKSIMVKAGRAIVSDGPYIETKEHVGGVWVLDCATPGEALEWGRKAAIACRAPVEVRAFN